MREEHRQGRLIVDAKTTLQEYLNNWLKVVQPSLSAKTFSDYERYVTQVIGPLLGKKVLSKLEPVMNSR
jgi:Phage integrase, N-terminal SAM-like domain